MGNAATRARIANARTGRYILVFKDGAAATGIERARNRAGLAAPVSGLESLASDFTILGKLGAAVVAADDDQATRLRDDGDDSLVTVVPERLLSLPKFTEESEAQLEAVARFDETAATWGLQAIGALQS